jgi:hypothetical protein
VGEFPIADDLWWAAAELAEVHGVFRTAKVLRLDYTKLKGMTASTGRKQQKASTPPRFIEFFPAVSGAGESVIELEGARGKMRIH